MYVLEIRKYKSKTVPPIHFQSEEVRDLYIVAKNHGILNECTYDKYTFTIYSQTGRGNWIVWYRKDRVKKFVLWNVSDGDVLNKAEYINVAPWDVKTEEVAQAVDSVKTQGTDIVIRLPRFSDNFQLINV